MNDPWWLAGGVSPANCVAAYQPIGADSLQASYLNLANPGTYNAAPGIAPTFNNITGWIFSNTDQYLDSGITPKQSQEQSLIIRYSNYTTNFSYLMGSINSEAVWGTGFALGYINSKAFGNGDYKVSGAHNTAGVLCVAGNAGYFDGAYVVGDIGVWTGPGSSMYIGGMHDPTGLVNQSLASIQAIAYYTITLTEAQIGAITHAINALTGDSLPTYHMPSAGMRRWAKLYSQEGAGAAFVPAWARNSNRIITPGVMLP